MHITWKARKVAKAVALLDRLGPEDWRDRVDLDKLDLHSGMNCVLGQVYASEAGHIWSYTYGRQQLGIDDSTVFDSNEYRREWRRQIRKGKGKR